VGLKRNKASSTRFNPTRVRLKRSAGRGLPPTSRRFNPTRVRLKRSDLLRVDEALFRFNPTRVRLKPVEQIVGGMTEFASTPQGFV